MSLKKKIKHFRKIIFSYTSFEYKSIYKNKKTMIPLIVTSLALLTLII